MKIYIVLYTSPNGLDVTPCETRSRAEYEASEILKTHKDVFLRDEVCGFEIYPHDLPEDILGKFKEWISDHTWECNVEVIEEEVRS